MNPYNRDQSHNPWSLDIVDFQQNSNQFTQQQDVQQQQSQFLLLQHRYSEELQSYQEEQERKMEEQRLFFQSHIERINLDQERERQSHRDLRFDFNL